MNNPAKNLYEEIDFIGKNDFDFVDLTLEPPKAYKDINIDKIKNLLKKYELSVIGHTAWYLNINYPFASVRDAALEEAYYSLEVFNKLNVKFVNVHFLFPISSLFAKEQALVWYSDFLNKIVKEAKKYNMKIMIENVSGSDDEIDFIDKIFKKVPGLMFHLDIGHANLLTEKNKTDKFLKLFSKRLAHVHLSDNVGGGDDLHLPLGAGRIEWKNIIRLLKRYKYDKTITLEIFSEERGYLLMSKEKLKRLWKSVK